MTKFFILTSFLLFISNATFGDTSLLSKSCFDFLSYFVNKPRLEVFTNAYNLVKNLNLGDEVQLTLSNEKKIEGIVQKLSENNIYIKMNGEKEKKISFSKISLIKHLKISEAEESLRVLQLKKFLKQKAIELETWGNVKKKYMPQINQFKKRSKVDQEKTLNELDEQIKRMLFAKVGSENIGLHYNLHGGNAFDYVQKGGIRSSISDPAGDHGIVTREVERTRKVFFFRLGSMKLHEVLDKQHPKYLFRSKRMGDVLIFFNLNDHKILKMKETKEIVESEEIFISFKESNNLKFQGIPETSFIGSPFHVFKDVKSTIKEKLSKEQETLAQMYFFLEFFKKNEL